MRTVHHPTLPGVTRDVDDKHVDDWKAAGWRLTKPRPVDDDQADATPTTPAAATAADQGQHSDEGENHG